MNEKRVAEKLKELRELKFPDRSEFIRKSKLEHQAVEEAENGDRMLTIPRLEKWLAVCGTTLSAFFADLEKEEGRSVGGVEIVTGFEEYYSLLTKIIKSRDSLYVDGIYSSLVGLSIAAELGSTSKQERGNIARKEKRRKG